MPPPFCPTMLFVNILKLSLFRHVSSTQNVITLLICKPGFGGNHKIQIVVGNVFTYL